MPLRILALISLFLSPIIGSGQILVSGKITSEFKEGIPFANIATDGKTISIADQDGTFEFSLIEPFEIITISAIGFKEYMVAAADIDLNEPLHFVLDQDIFSLDEVNVKGVSMIGSVIASQKLAGSAQYISNIEIEKFRATDINRVLKSIPGVNLQEEDGFGLRPNIGLRGSGSLRSEKITLMEDGVLIAPAPYSAPAAYYFPSFGRIHSLEILKGASQIKYGPNTNGGAINLLSAPIPSELGIHADVSGGSFGFLNLHAKVGDSKGNFGYVLETFSSKTDGFKELQNDEDTGFTKTDLHGKVRWNTRPEAAIYQSLTFKIVRQEEDSNETYLGLSDKDFRSNPYKRYDASQRDNMKSDQIQVSLKHVISPAKNVDVVTTAYRNRFSRNWYKLDKVKDSTGSYTSISGVLDNTEDQLYSYQILSGTLDVTDASLYVKANNRSYISQGIQTALRWSPKSDRFSHVIEFSTRWHEDEMDRFQWADEYNIVDGSMTLMNSGVPGTESNRLESAKALASFVNYTLKYKGWTFTPGLRLESIKKKRLDFGKEDPIREGTNLKERENKTTVFIPGLGVEKMLSGNDKVFAGIYKGFAPAGSNEGSQEESSINYELGYKFFKPNLHIEIIGFYNDYDNLLGSDLNAGGGAGSTDLFNGGEVSTFGIEALFNKTLSLDNGMEVPLGVNYTYTDATFDSSFDSGFDAWGTVTAGDELPYISRHTVGISAGLIYKPFSVHFNGRFQDRMRTEAGATAKNSTNSTDSYFVLDLALEYKMTKHIALFTNVNNLTDQTYIASRRPAGLRPGLPRTFIAGVVFDLHN